ncbi:uncharacterized protein PITG_15295 [Phytophthora infestans T30-4]|uniref:Transmembrane protein n=1 Tax=Phytophthora infestans (strain T30-4) TaxID=403677 RepID=D0NQD2_PHYIT|nr:uncharacterized protein PITG_15295 [Phytophthora infestans T30-4]EEY62864.1 conserved hypothetical protein [Phytophthora infestans T30-4]|eukprot:XP_002898739.1 conserved hypothetical protein [Phytophthora infestans T30-4]
MAVAYPAYQLLFNSVARSAYELPVFLLLLALKIALKNLVSLDLAELADLIPENIIFTNHFFNAIYLATSLYGIYRSSTRIMKQLRHTIGPSMSEDKLLFAAYLLCHCYGKFTKEERAQVQHIASLRKTLATLFTIECMILAEYVEFVIPLLYGNYILMMVHLPSARYHTELTGVNEENVVSTVHMVFLYGLLEFGVDITFQFSWMHDKSHI